MQLSGNSHAPSKKILITGGGGFIGSHLLEFLLDRGDSVTVLDDFSTGCMANIADWLSHPGFSLIQSDVSVSFDLEVDQIYHLACPASPVKYQLDAVRTMKTSVLGTLNVCALAKKYGARLVFSSTSEVYGDPTVHPQSEEYWGNVNPVGPRSCYDEGKRAAETICSDFRRKHGVDARIARIFNTYGPRMAFDDGRVVSNFIVQCLQGQSLSLYGDGSQTRSFCFVDDLVRGLIALMEADSVNGPVNLGNPHELSVKDLGLHVFRRLNQEPRFELRSLPEDDPRQRQPDISRAKRVLNWEPVVSLEDGLARTIADFKSRLAKHSTQAQVSHQLDAHSSIV